MNILNYNDVKTYLQNQQVYFKKEISNIDFKTIAESGKVYNIGIVELNRISEDRIVFSIVIDGIEITMYEHKTDLELFGWIKINFIPISELIECWENN